jgi:hypothetical protein
MIDIVEILVHWHAGRSQNELATSLGGWVSGWQSATTSRHGGTSEVAACGAT